MAELNLTGQRNIAKSLVPSFQSFKDEMEKRKIIWLKMDRDRRLKWFRAACGTKDNPKSFTDSKDPIFWLAYNLKLFLSEFELE